MSPGETSEITLARFAAGVRVRTRCPLTLTPHEDVVERECFLSASSRRELIPLAFEARVV